MLDAAKIRVCHVVYIDPTDCLFVVTRLKRVWQVLSPSTCPKIVSHFINVSPIEQSCGCRGGILSVDKRGLL
jgi:hypothetical protein